VSRSKKIFAAFAIVFFCILAYVVYDISSRTTFPGSKKTERPEDLPYDSAGTENDAAQDTLQNTLP
jgi:hypothetical protein